MKTDQERVHVDLNDYFDNGDKDGWKTITVFGAVKKRTDNSTSICLRHRTYKGNMYVDLALWKKKLDGTLTRLNKGFHLDIESFQFLVLLIKEYSKNLVLTGDLKDPKNISLLKSVTYAVKELPDDIRELENIMIEDMSMKQSGHQPVHDHPIEYYNTK